MAQPLQGVTTLAPHLSTVSRTHDARHAAVTCAGNPALGHLHWSEPELGNAGRDSDPRHTSRKIRKFRTDKFDTGTNGSYEQQL